jgi:hypothetical protein
MKSKAITGQFWSEIFKTLILSSYNLSLNFTGEESAKNAIKNRRASEG